MAPMSRATSGSSLPVGINRPVMPPCLERPRKALGLGMCVLVSHGERTFLGRVDVSFKFPYLFLSLWKRGRSSHVGVGWGREAGAQGHLLRTSELSSKALPTIHPSTPRGFFLEVTDWHVTASVGDLGLPNQFPSLAAFPSQSSLSLGLCHYFSEVTWVCFYFHEDFDVDCYAQRRLSGGSHSYGGESPRLSPCSSIGKLSKSDEQLSSLDRDSGQCSRNTSCETLGELRASWSLLSHHFLVASLRSYRDASHWLCDLGQVIQTLGLGFFVCTVRIPLPVSQGG